jgi:hypothetical protein
VLVNPLHAVFSLLISSQYLGSEHLCSLSQLQSFSLQIFCSRVKQEFPELIVHALKVLSHEQGPPSPLKVIQDSSPYHTSPENSLHEVAFWQDILLLFNSQPEVEEHSPWSEINSHENSPQCL